jgi:aspartate 1-decarboxylase
MVLKHFLRSKLHNVAVTEANVEYAGSISIDRDLIDAAGLQPFEMVKVVNIDNGERFETYVIEADSGSGCIGLNGGAARKGKIGDRLIIFSTIWLEPGGDHQVKVIVTDSNNKIQDTVVKKTKV